MQNFVKSIYRSLGKIFPMLKMTKTATQKYDITYHNLHLLEIKMSLAISLFNKDSNLCVSAAF